MSLHTGKTKAWDAAIKDWISLGNLLQESFQSIQVVKPSSPSMDQRISFTMIQEFLTKIITLLSIPKPPAVCLPKCVMGKDLMIVSGRKIPFTRSMSKGARNQILNLPTINEREPLHV